MIKRTVLINKAHPTSSGTVETVKVSIPCEPWETPDPVVQAVVAAVKPKSPHEAVIAAVKAGHQSFTDITNAAFSSLSGTAQNKSRKALNELRDLGVLTCEHIPGRAMKWGLKSASF